MDLTALGRQATRRLSGSVNALIDDLAGLSSHARDWQIMIFAGETIEVYRRGKGGLERIAALGADFDSRALKGLQSCLASVPHKKVALRFSPERAVTRTVALPVSAQDVIAAIVRNKVESLAPWPLSEALWGFKRLEDRAQAGQLNVEVGIIGRKSIEGLLAWLGKSGTEVRQIDIADSAQTEGGIDIDFMRENKTERIRRRFKVAMTALGLSTAACAGVGAYFLISAMNELEQIESRTSELTGALRDQSSDSAEGSKLSEGRKLVERKKTEQPAIQIVESLTRSIPNSAWIETLDYEDHQLTIVGRGTSIPPIVDALEKSGVFADVNFASPTQHDAVAKVDSFSSSASVPPTGVTQ
jgi:general secretion pathway protein L